MEKDILFDINDFDDKNVWDFICSGKTKGVFQLESNLGRHWAKQLRPQNISELAALISVIRPGTLKAKVDGKSMTQHYCDRKASKDPVVYQHESLEEILEETYGVLVYQEQSMMIAQKLAGFDLKDADSLRKAIGKKKADLMEEVKKMFLHGVEQQNIVSKETGEEIFSWIEKSNRYAFNKCLSPKTVVITENGEKCLDELTVGDKVLAPKNIDQDEFVEVLDIIDNGEKFTAEVTLANGKTIICTIEHKFLTNDNKIEPLYKIVDNNLLIMCIDKTCSSVVNINFLGNMRTMDIEVSNNSHIFYGNGIATSNSHAVSYAINAYWSAYCKYYRPLEFYTSYLNHAHGKPDPQQEIKELILDAKLNDIDIYPPRLGHIYKDFHNVGGKIFFGLSHVKNIGDSECDKLINSLSNDAIKNFTWIECLIEIIHKLKINKRAVISMLSIGALNGKNNTTPRKTMLYEFDSWQQLTAREKQYIAENYNNSDSLYDAINRMLENFKLTPKRRCVIADINKSLISPFYSIDDSIQTIAQDEEKFMGCALTCSKADASEESFGATLCKDISNGLITGKTNIVACINSVREYKTKKGKNPGQTMAFLCVEDSSGILDSVTVFPEAYSEYRDLLIERNTVLVHGEISKKDKSSLIVNKVKQV